MDNMVKFVTFDACDNKRTFWFDDEAVGLSWLKSNVEFDYLVINDSTLVMFDDIEI